MIEELQKTLNFEAWNVISKKDIRKLGKKHI